MVIALVVAFVMPAANRTAVAGTTPQCLATGQRVDSNYTGLDVQPCPQASLADDNDNDSLQESWSDPPTRFNNALYWGYEANFFAPRLNLYRATLGNPMVASCVPSGPDVPATSNGRGVAFDPLDGNLWISRLFFFSGDAKITKIVAPLPGDTTCMELYTLFVHFNDGKPPQQPGFGALDVDDSKHIWAAGYGPVINTITGQSRNYFYQVNRRNGLIIHSCFLPAAPDQSNDSLTFARLRGVPGSGRYLLTDNGDFSAANPLLLIDVSTCHNGNQVTPVATYANPGSNPTSPHFGTGVSGIDLGLIGLLNTDTQFSFINSGTPPFAASTLLGPTLAVNGLEDVALCSFRAKLDYDGDDFCPCFN